MATEFQMLVKTRYAAHDPLHRHPAQAPSGKTQRYLLRNRRRTDTRHPGATLVGMEPLLVEQRGTVRRLLLNRPERRNALEQRQRTGSRPRPPADLPRADARSA
ncbi:hypothetical protein AB0D34_34830 [Streptomyces sp. NPDC048420]|uniref:hypothetical protein n=1 Tax=Streptomyces sp. NPDC048420 TaxID=3155755 RepID=UPI0034363179